jgi:hypothetical protein
MPDVILGLYGGYLVNENKIPACTCYTCGETLYEGEEAVKDQDGAIYCDEMCGRVEWRKFNALAGTNTTPQFRQITLQAPEPTDRDE